MQSGSVLAALNRWLSALQLKGENLAIFLQALNLRDTIDPRAQLWPFPGRHGPEVCNGVPLPRGSGGQEGFHHRGHPGMLPGKWQLAGRRVADHPEAQRDPQPERLPLRYCGEDSGGAV